MIWAKANGTSTVCGGLLSKVLPANQVFQDFEMMQKFPGLGFRTMLLNGRLLPMGGPDQDLILLAIEDVTDRRQAEQALKDSEAKLRDLARQLLALQEAGAPGAFLELQESLAQNITALKLELRTFEEKLPAKVMGDCGKITAWPWKRSTRLWNNCGAGPRN